MNSKSAKTTGTKKNWQNLDEIQKSQRRASRSRTQNRIFPKHGNQMAIYNHLIDALTVALIRKKIQGGRNARYFVPAHCSRDVVTPEQILIRLWSKWITIMSKQNPISKKSFEAGQEIRSETYSIFGIYLYLTKQTIMNRAQRKPKFPTPNKVYGSSGEENP